MTRLDEFISFLENQVKNHSIYIWGGQGQMHPTLTEEWIKKKETGSNRTKALATFRAAVAAGCEKVCRAFDCSGLGTYWLILRKLINGDMTAHGMMGICTSIQKKHVKRGDWLFRVYTSGSKKGRAYHIGYMVTDEEFIEARGRAYGVVRRRLADVGNYWNAFGRPHVFAEFIDTDEEIAEHMSFNRNLKKGMKGDDVRELQKLLNKAGDDIAVDGNFGAKTQEAVKVFQSRRGLKADGIAGKDTIAALLDVPVAWSIIRELSVGAQGWDVKHLQTALIAAGYSVGLTGVDGDFGRRTLIAVNAFQKAKGLKVDGVVGKNTVEALGGRWQG